MRLKRIFDWWAGGGGIITPSIQASNLTITGVTSTTQSWSLTRGNGAFILVLAKSGSTVNATPVDGTDYTMSSTFGSGSEIGTGNYVVYKGTADNFSVSGLTQDVQYHYRAFEFNGTGSATKYNTSTATFNPNSEYTFLTMYQTYIDRITTKTYTQDSLSLKIGKNKFLRDLGSGLRGRMKYGCFIRGADVRNATLNVPSPTTFESTIVGTLTFDTGFGAKSNGSSYINVPYKSNQYAGIQSDITAALYISEDSTVNVSGSAYGFMTGAGNYFTLDPKNGGNCAAYHYYASGHNIANGNHKNLYIHTYDGSNNVVYIGGTKNQTAKTVNAPTNSINLYLFAYHETSPSDAPLGFYTRYMEYFFLFDRFNDSDAATFKSAHDTYAATVFF